MCQTSQIVEVTEGIALFSSKNIGVPNSGIGLFSGKGNAVHHAQDASNDTGNSQVVTAANFAGSSQVQHSTTTVQGIQNVMFNIPQFTQEQNSSGHVKGIGREDNGLYMFYSRDASTIGLQVPSTISKLLVPKPPPIVNMTKNNRIMDVALWHKRLGHTLKKTLRSIVVFQDCECKNTTESCNVCPLAKQTRLPFLLSTTNTNVCFHTLYCDVWGPYRVLTYDGKKYFLTLIDDYSRYCWIFLLPTKAEVIVALRSFILMIQNMYSASVKIFRSDNGSEFLNSQVAELLRFLSNTTSETAAGTGEASSGGGHDVSMSLPAEPSLPLSSPLLALEAPLTRMSNRDSRPPIWMKNYVTHNRGKSYCCYPISTCVNYDNVSSSFGSALAIYSVIVEPKTFAKAVKDPKWIAEMKDKILVLEDNNAWSIVTLPPRKMPIGCKWVFKVKYTSTGEVQTELVLVLVYVDDLLVTGNSPSLILQTRNDLKLKFKIKDLGELNFFLGIEFARSKQGIVMSQRKYALELIVELGLGGAKPVGTSLETSYKLTSVVFDSFINKSSSNEADTEDKELENAGLYQRPKQSHIDVALRVVRYIKTAPGLGLLKPLEGSEKLEVYCDSDWVGCLQTRRSVTRYVVKVGDALIS
ncbi:uncharacterized protein LOC142182120 [Nicotiana tabacum]|uniref:Uncharacterized protein LOC142182120 n=1 Tax=Nicotiana tabacum TaxID=4097 RepID=A0AC58URQ8_TOBAC